MRGILHVFRRIVHILGKGDSSKEEQGNAKIDREMCDVIVL